MKATTIGQALKLGVATGDFEFDLRKGFEDCEKFGTPFQYEHKQCSTLEAAKETGRGFYTPQKRFSIS